MKPIFNPTIGAYYNNRAFEIAQAAKYLGTDRMVNAHDELSYGQSVSGHLIINVKRHPNAVNIVFANDHMEMYHADRGGYVKCCSSRAYYEYSTLDACRSIEKTREFIWIAIDVMLNNSIDDHMTAASILEHGATAIHNNEWCKRLNGNIEQIRECAKFITDQNMGYGQAFYGYNDMGRLIVWLKHHPSINVFELPEKDRENSIIVEFEGDGILVIHNADEFGMPKNDKYRGLIDDHWSSVRAGKQHSYFIEKVKKECGVHLL